RGSGAADAGRCAPPPTHATTVSCGSRSLDLLDAVDRRARRPTNREVQLLEGGLVGRHPRESRTHRGELGDEVGHASEIVEGDLRRATVAFVALHAVE